MSLTALRAAAKTAAAAYAASPTAVTARAADRAYSAVALRTTNPNAYARANATAARYGLAAARLA